MLRVIKKKPVRNEQPKPRKVEKTNRSDGIKDPTVKGLLMFVVFLCALMTVVNFFAGAAVAYLISKPAGGAFFTASGATLGLAYKMVKLLIER